MLNSVHADIAMTLRPFSSALEMWLHLCNVSQQSNLAQNFEVERNIAEYTRGDKNVRSFYTDLQLLWSEHDQISRQNMSTAGLKEVLGERKRTRMVHFLMKLRPKFESICGSLLNREVTPAITLANCPKKKKFCAYCKITGNHISDCRHRPNCSRPAHQAYQKDVTKSASSFPSEHDLERLIRDFIATAFPEPSQFDDDVVATDPPEQPMNYDYDDLQPSYSSVIDYTYASSSFEEQLSHPVTPLR
ncbi:hypothetical protein H5410_037166 [Solanum commersonii]|uniref:Retrotransposon gag domain-containing protein n=1 Tax=Solanum commersonii TaxID=4109 RepID=A0A9J5YAE3_SOLCO|nr:hypothetical protein H5410_037166 [Solanum commersonii]